MSEHRVFESLCLDPAVSGYSYDPKLLVDVDRCLNFDEAVIRLTTKCASIVTQFRTLGHQFAQFCVVFAKVPKVGSPSKGSLKGSPKTSTADTRNLRLMEVEWRRLKKKDYSGMVALARISRSSIPRNGAGGKYSVRAYTETLIGNVHSYFMFQSYSPAFERYLPGEESLASTHTSDGADDEYLMYLVYRLHHQPEKRNAKNKRKTSEIEKLDLQWPYNVRKQRHTSGESSVSSCSSASSTPSGGPSCLTPPLTSPLTTDDTWASRVRKRKAKSPALEPIITDWETESAPPGLGSPTASPDEDPFQKTPVRVRSMRRRFSSTSSQGSKDTSLRSSPRLRSRSHTDSDS